MFAERLKEARKAKRYSQAEVSRMLGVTQQAVGKWETGRSTPDPQTVARLAEILDTPTDVLLGLRKESGAASAVGRNASAAIRSPRSPSWARCAPDTGPSRLRRTTARSMPVSRTRKTTSSSSSRATAWNRASLTVTWRLYTARTRWTTVISAFWSTGQTARAR